MRVACVKYVGLAAGGTEKYIQNIAVILAQAGHSVDFYYTNLPRLIGSDWVHPDNKEERKQFLIQNGVKVCAVNVQSRYTDSSLPWNNTNFFDVFKESDYDIVQTARGGYSEYPFNHMSLPMIDSIHSDVGEDRPNIKRVILLCEWQANRWGSNGGNLSKAVIIPPVVEIPQSHSSIRSSLGIPENAFVFGSHQRDSDDIYSPVALEAYAKIQNPNTYFIMMGGSNRYRTLAQNLGLKNMIFLNFSNNVHDFLASINVFAHARSDGEVCSAAIIEALYHGLPVVTHPAQNMGHMDQINGCGKMCYTVEEYVAEMQKLIADKSYLDDLSYKAKQRYLDRYEYTKIKSMILSVYSDALK